MRSLCVWLTDGFVGVVQGCWWRSSPAKVRSTTAATYGSHNATSITTASNPSWWCSLTMEPLDNPTSSRLTIKVSCLTSLQSGNLIWGHFEKKKKVYILVWNEHRMAAALSARNEGLSDINKFNAVQSPDRLGRRRDMRDDSAESEFWFGSSSRDPCLISRWDW